VFIPVFLVVTAVVGRFVIRQISEFQTRLAADKAAQQRVVSSTPSA
jgi:predicted transcriptional regulator